jgi:membrane protease YdiL (CAAX protease family)
MTSPLPGSPYHRLAHTPAHRWWRPLLGTVVIVSGYLIAIVVLMLALAVVGVLIDRPEDTDGLPVFGAIPDLAVDLIFVILLLPPVLLAARWVQRRPVGTLSSVLGRLRWRWMLGCGAVSVVMVVLLWVASTALLAVTGGDTGGGEKWVGLGTFVAGLAVVLVLVPFQAAAEEYVCRGWLLQAVGAFVRTPWLPIAVQALVFAALHGLGTPWGFADLIVFGVAAGWLAVRTGGLEATIALHVLNNLAAFVLSAAVVGGLSSDETATDAGWQVAVVDMTLVVLYAVVVRWLAKRFTIATTVPESPADLRGVGDAGDLGGSQLDAGRGDVVLQV